MLAAKRKPYLNRDSSYMSKKYVVENRHMPSQQNSESVQGTLQVSTICPCEGGCPRCNPAQNSIPKIQPKLRISQPEDPLEKEADDISEKIVGMDYSSSSDTKSGNENKCKEQGYNNNKKQNQINKKNNPKRHAVKGSIETNETKNVIKKITSNGGEPLESTTKEFMESRFGYDFSNVKIYTDREAERSAKSIDAVAYTAGNNITFARGQYSPQTLEGRRLLAHELTHVIQQSRTNNSASHRSYGSNLRNIGEKAESTLQHKPLIQRQPAKQLSKKSEGSLILLRAKSEHLALFDVLDEAVDSALIDIGDPENLRIQSTRRGWEGGAVVCLEE